MNISTEGKDWFHQFREGDENAFQRVFELYYRPIVYFALQILREDSYAEDIASESFRKAWEYRERFETIRHLENFLYFVTRNSCISYLRSDRVIQTTQKEWSQLLSDEEKEAPLDMEKVQTQLIGLIYQHLEKISGGEILRMAYLEGKSTKEIAQTLNITENTVYITKSRSLKLLRTLLAKHDWMLFVFFFKLNCLMIYALNF
jgi:RNA polymerase sigma factor (sigma-70 family)